MPGWTKLAGYAVVGGIVATIIVLLGWILTPARREAAPAPAPPRGKRSAVGLAGIGRPAGLELVSAVLVPLAHHPLFVALPFVLPVLVLTLGVAVLAFRERRRREREPA